MGVKIDSWISAAFAVIKTQWQSRAKTQGCSLVFVPNPTYGHEL